MSKALTSPKKNLALVRLRALSFPTPQPLYALHRTLFRLTNGVWNDVLSWVLGRVNGKYGVISNHHSIFKYQLSDVERLGNSLRKDGYFETEITLPSPFVDQLVEFSKSAPLYCVLPTENYGKEGSKVSPSGTTYAEARGNFARCDLRTKDLVQNPTVQKIALDPFLLAVAQNYLAVKPILSSLCMWWSFPVTDAKKHSAAAAQEYHFDMDHLKFVKFFFYLTDVHERNGPHCFVRGTHKNLPRKFLKRGRFSDQDVEDSFPNDSLELKGKKGTLIGVDTRGLHKGKILTADSRLLFQVQFSNSLFGQKTEALPFANLAPDLLRFGLEHAESYFNFL